jgi:hypothetical protein
MSSVVISGDTSGTVTLSAPATAGSTTLTLPATSGTLLQSGTAVTVAQGGTGLTTAGTLGNVLTSDGTNWTSSAPPAAGGMTLLGTIVTTSGTTVTLSGLTLTSYKQLQCQFNGTTLNNSGMNLNGNALFSVSSVAKYGYVLIDLTTGYFNSQNGTSGATPGNFANTSGLTTASTSISFVSTNASFTAGSILVYGVK